MEVQRSKIIELTRSYIGLRYQHMGRDRIEGVDCIGLVAMVLSDLGVKIIDEESYSSSASAGTLFNAIDKNLDRIKASEIKPGDVMVFWFNHRNVPQHIAVNNGDTMIHCNADSGQVVEHVSGKWWNKRLMCGYRFRGMELI